MQIFFDKIFLWQLYKALHIKSFQPTQGTSEKIRLEKSTQTQKRHACGHLKKTAHKEIQSLVSLERYDFSRIKVECISNANFGILVHMNSSICHSLILLWFLV